MNLAGGWDRLENNHLQLLQSSAVSVLNQHSSILSRMDYSLQHHETFVGSHVSELPTPAFVVRKHVVESNISQLHQDVENLNIDFRPHVKTLKVRIFAVC